MKEKNEEKEIQRDFNLGDKVYFYLSNSLDIHEGKVVGFYLVFQKEGDDNKSVYWYQCEYDREMVDGTFKKYYATVPTSEIKTDKNEIEKIFEPLRKQRLTDAIKQELKNEEGINVDIKSAQEALEEVAKEKASLLEKYEKSYGIFKNE